MRNILRNRVGLCYVMTPGVLVRTSGSTLSEMRSHGMLLADKYCNVMFYTIILAVGRRVKEEK